MQTLPEQDHRIPADKISSHQKEIEKAFRKGKRHLQICARAGTGKTTLLRHLSSFTKAGVDDVLYLAFNKKNAVEGQRKMPRHVTSSTAHAYCNGFLRRCLQLPPLERFKTWRLLDDLYPHRRDPERRRQRRVVNTLVSLAKNFACRPDSTATQHHVTPA